MTYLKNKEAKKIPSTYIASLNSVHSIQNQIKSTAEIHHLKSGCKQS